jgi:hypothetical protein
MNTQYREEARGKKADTRKQKHQTSDFYLSNEFHTDVQRSFGLFHFVCRAGDQTQGLAHARQRSVVELHPQPLVLLRESCYVAQAGLELMVTCIQLLISGITGVLHPAQPFLRPS